MYMSYVPPDSAMGWLFSRFPFFVCSFLGKMGQRNVWRALKINVAYFAVPAVHPHTSHNIKYGSSFLSFYGLKFVSACVLALLQLPGGNCQANPPVCSLGRWEILHSFWDSSHWQFTKRFSCSMCGRYAIFIAIRTIIKRKPFGFIDIFIMGHAGMP